jgi:hypothetical protein
VSKGALRPAHSPQGGSDMRNSFKKFVLLLAALFCSFTAASLMQNTSLHHMLSES